MLLVYNPDSDGYEGQRISVPRWLWDDGVAELVEGGIEEAEARRRLLDEACWLDVEGTMRLQPLWLCLQCRAVVPDRRRFCDVVCEAAFIAEVRG